jgi:molybdopterin-guanine dinucleotide biosynthesis protein A
MDKLPVYIVAGGRSRRFGSDKARALLSGVPMIRRVADALDPISQSVTVVASTAGVYKDLGLMTIGDLRPCLGPIGGLDAALADRVARHGKGWLLLASCDLTSPRADWVRCLMGHVKPNAVTVAFKGERWEPLFALYHTSIRGKIRRQVDTGFGALWRLIEQTQHVEVPLPDGMSGVTQINTRHDMDQFAAGRG